MLDKYMSSKLILKEGLNPRNLFSHQEKAFFELEKYNSKNFSSLISIPTGAGKTLTASFWILKKYLKKEENKRVIWIANRIELLEQALDSFRSNFYSDISDIETLNYKIISSQDSNVSDFFNRDRLIIASISSIQNNSTLDAFVKKMKSFSTEEVLIVIDEAHHTVSNSCVKVINKIKENFPTKLLGLTATPTRTLDAEKTKLFEIYKDGIIYKIDLLEMIINGVLATPIFHEFKTNFSLLDNIDISDEIFDSLSKFNIKDIEKKLLKLAINENRNNFISSKYIENMDKYGQTIIFALNIENAKDLNSLFIKKGIKSAYLISSEFSKIERKKILESFMKKEIQVLINVEILKEGTDIPNIETVFLARPTMSAILMTQMIGRGLRGEKSKIILEDGSVVFGTSKVNIVSFIDDWGGKISWKIPQSIFNEDDNSEESILFCGKNMAKKELMNKLGLNDILKKALLGSQSQSDLTSMIEDITPLGLYFFPLKFDSNNLDFIVFNNELDGYKELEKNIEEESVLFCLDFKHITFLEKKYFLFSSDYNKVQREFNIESCIKYYLHFKSFPKFFCWSDKEKTNINDIVNKIYNEVMEVSLSSFKVFLDKKINEFWDNNEYMSDIYNFECFYELVYELVRIKSFVNNKI